MVDLFPLMNFRIPHAVFVLRYFTILLNCHVVMFFVNNARFVGLIMEVVVLYVELEYQTDSIGFMQKGLQFVSVCGF